MSRGRVWVAALCLGVCFIPGEVRAAVRYVDAAASGDNNGIDWPNAHTSLQTALLAAQTNPTITEIWVAAGVYTPGATRFATFQMIDGVALHGGFVGTEVLLAERTGAAGPSILSGDIGAPGNAADNSYHVVTGSNVGPSAVLEGFTIAHGAADLSALKRVGGGMIIEAASSAPTIINCTFRDNSAVGDGGGLYNIDGAPTIVNCVFRNNTTMGAGNGGGLFSDRGMAQVINCTFIHNSAGGRGGGAFSPRYDGTSCPNNASFSNCIFFHNDDAFGTGQDAQIRAALVFCPPEFSQRAPNPFVLTHSCIQNWDGVLGGPTNFGDDPLLADADGRLTPQSPCVDAGINAALPVDTLDLDDDADLAEPVATDCDLRGRLVRGAVDVGAYEAQFDCNGNGVLDADDIAGGTSGDCNANGFPDECDTADLDCNGNGAPDDCDLAGGSSLDCNRNSVPDSCDIAMGTSHDCNTNGFADECELAFKFFILDNADVGAASHVRAFDLPTGASMSTEVSALPVEGNDRGMAILPGDGRLLVSDIANSRLLEINVFPSTITRIIPTDRPLLELTCDWETGRVYATTATGALYSVDLDTGFTTFVSILPGDSPLDWVCLAYDPLSRKLLGASQSERRMYAVDPATGDAIAFSQPFGLGLADLAVDRADNTIYGISVGGSLHMVDRATGSAGAALFAVAGVDDTAAGLAVSFTSDCNGNTLLDGCDLAGGTSADCNTNAVPDECEPDCNVNGIVDTCEVVHAGDFDADGDVDLVDALTLVDCLAGPAASPAPLASECAATCLAVFDLDDDGDVDLRDYSSWLSLFTG